MTSKMGSIIYANKDASLQVNVGEALPEGK